MNEKNANTLQDSDDGRENVDDELNERYMLSNGRKSRAILEDEADIIVEEEEAQNQDDEK